jgi:hypothetical protein
MYAPFAECGCGCGASDGEPLVGLLHRALAREVEAAHGASAMSFSRREVQHFRRSYRCMRSDGFERTTDGLKHCCDGHTCFAAPCPPLCGHKSAVGALGAGSRRVGSSTRSAESPHTCVVRSASCMRPVRLATADALGAQHASDSSVSLQASMGQPRTYASACTSHSSVE